MCSGQDGEAPAGLMRHGLLEWNCVARVIGARLMPRSDTMMALRGAGAWIAFTFVLGACILLSDAPDGSLG